MFVIFLTLAQQYKAVPSYELFAVSLIPVIIAYLFFYFGLKLEISGRSPVFKWLSLIPAGIGLFLTFEKFSLLFDPVYRFAFYIGKKEIVLNVFALLISLLGFLGLFVWGSKISHLKDE